MHASSLHISSEAASSPLVVLCSTAQRTRETLQLLLTALNSPDVRLERELYGASVKVLLDRLHDVTENVTSVMLIGHNPGLQELAIALTAPGRKRTLLESKFPTAALATIALPTTGWAKLHEGDAHLTEYVTPKQLRNIGDSAQLRHSERNGVWRAQRTQ